MNRDLRGYLPVLIAVGALALVILQTVNAFERADRLGVMRPSAKVAPDPYARLENLLAAADPNGYTAPARDPFTDPKVAPPPRVDVKPLPPPPPRPVVTAIISDGNAHSAIIRVGGRSYTVRAGELFAGFEVVSVSASDVVLDSGGERMTLRVSTKGR